MRTFLRFLAMPVVLIFASANANAQCATNAYFSGGANCISLVWFPAGQIPSPLPPSVTYDGNLYTLNGGLGDIGFPAVFKKSDLSCDLPSDLVNGDITINYVGGAITCKYPGGTLLALGDIDVKVRRLGTQNIIDWKAASNEIASLEIQRSTNARNFVPIKQIAAAGSEQAVRQGTHADPGAAGKAYYRIKVTATNGLFTFSKVVQVSDASTLATSVTPNPARGSFVLTGVNITNPLQVSMVDATGRKIGFRVIRFDAGAKTMQVAVEKNVTGIVIINCNNAEKQVLKALLQ